MSVVFLKAGRSLGSSRDPNGNNAADRCRGLLEASMSIMLHFHAAAWVAKYERLPFEAVACLHSSGQIPQINSDRLCLVSMPQMRHPPGYGVYKDLATAPSTEDLASPETKCQTTTNSTITKTRVPPIERYIIWRRLPSTQIRTALRKKDNCQSTSLHWPPN